jgi:ribonuclease P protein subunit POP4
MNKYQQEFIGKKIRIINAKNKTQQNIEGKIIDETKNTITIKTQNKTVNIIKKENIMEINGQRIDGKKITKRPEDRIKIKE